jgi:Type II CAAX prenyl endopeptidase Rce1-like
MKKIWALLKHHIKEDFHLPYYASIGIFLILFLFINYYFKFENNVLDAYSNFSRFFALLLFYGVGYYVSIALLSIFKKTKAFIIQPYFWLYSLFALVLLSLDGSVPYLNNFIYDHFDTQLTYWVYKVSVNGISFFTILIPLLIFHFIFDKQERDYYGLNQRKADLKPYWSLLLLMLPLLLSASFLESFQRQYPMYKSNNAYLLLNVPEWLTALTYEIAYGLDFITVELLFRGFLVIGMIKILGRNAIVPMAVIYCMLHFGKPMGEAISSIFGGYILGVVAYETRSVWGGIIVHMGIAWLMEIIAYGQKLLH